MASVEAAAAAKSRGSRRAAGHKGTVVANGFFHKLVSTSGGRFENEHRFLTMITAYRELSSRCWGWWAVSPEPMLRYIPRFHGLVELNGSMYLQMDDLLAGFNSPSLMDVKMGVRAFEEKELTSEKPRADLFERLVKMERRLPAAVLTDEERAAGSVTKARWMGLRDSMSSTQSLGFRVDAVLTRTEHHSAFTSHLFHTKEEADIIKTWRSFLPKAADCHCGVTPRDMARRIHATLAELRAALSRSALFRQHEFIGSTLLFVADGSGKATVSMIDFGVTTAAPAGGLRHDVPWELGNHEDGYLIGLANLERVWGVLVDEDVWL